MMDEKQLSKIEQAVIDRALSGGKTGDPLLALVPIMVNALRQANDTFRAQQESHERASAKWDERYGKLVKESQGFQQRATWLYEEGVRYAESVRKLLQQRQAGEALDLDELEVALDHFETALQTYPVDE